jgi:hypothetical protein
MLMAANPPVLPPLRSHRAVVYSVAAAAIAVAVCALIGIAWMLGRVGSRAAAPAPSAAIAVPRPQVTAVGLEPGETVVSAADAAPRTEPMMPTYSQPAAPIPAPTTRDEGTSPAPVPVPARKAPAPAPEKREAYVQADPGAPGPTTPTFTRGPGVCINCGIVSAITTYPPGLWEVRVRMEDGELQAFHFRRQPSFRIGERVRADGSRLARD